MGRVNENDNNSVGGEISLQGRTKILQIWHVYFFFCKLSRNKKKTIFLDNFLYVYNKIWFFFMAHIA